MHWLGITNNCSPALTVYNYKNRFRSLTVVCLALRSGLFGQGPMWLRDGLSVYLVSQGWICPCFQEQRNCFNIPAEHCCMESRSPILRENDSVCQELSSQPSALCLTFIINRRRDAVGTTQSYCSVSFLCTFQSHSSTCCGVVRHTAR